VNSANFSSNAAPDFIPLFFIVEKSSITFFELSIFIIEQLAGPRIHKLSLIQLLFLS
jgi:hypothetical protein